MANIRAGRIVQGGSTITQQTAKNLFKRESRTLQAKLKELLYALRLEYHYPKEKILEFYVNQFFVSGNGYGLGVAARYYFDKEVDQLTLLENAFIAGSVKRPNYYNPFTKITAESKEIALNRAKIRADYVLSNMRRLGYIDQTEYGRAKTDELAFQRGRMSFSLNTVMDLVRDGLASSRIREVLDKHGISNISTSGIRVYTTVERELQDQSLYTLRRELSRLDIRLRGYDREEVQREYARLEYPGDLLADPLSFHFGRIKDLETDNEGQTHIRISFERQHIEGVIPPEGLDQAVIAVARHKRQRWSEAGKDDRAYLLAQLVRGDRVYVSIRGRNPSGMLILDLEKFPELEGAALVMQNGAIRAMAGGMENRYFNRAIDAKRAMGSTFKPFLFAASLQLGWSPVDLLDNRRDVFVYQDRPYFPRPDHHSPFEQVSMSWAGVQSENLAAIWLLYHLTDYLNPPRLREVAGYLDLAPRQGERPETNSHFRGRIRDTYGIRVTGEILRQAAYDRAVDNLEADFLFDGRIAEYRQLQQLHYGLHFDEYAEDLETKLAEEEGELSQAENKELELRRQILARNYLALAPVVNALREYRVLFDRENKPVWSFNPLILFDNESGNVGPPGGFRHDSAGRVIFSLAPPREEWQAIPEDTIRERLAAQTPEEQEEFWQSIILEGRLSLYAYQQVTAQMDREYEQLSAADPYSMEVLSSIRDYRLLVGLQYLIRLAGEAGVDSELEPVLSFPLGSNVISLLESVRMYETMITGKAFNREHHAEDDEFAGEGLAVIERIETQEGEVVYSRSGGNRQIFDALSSSSVSNILQNTIRYGTGRYAGENVSLISSDPTRQKLLSAMDLSIPLLGKTGTANQFRNAAFIGYVPVFKENEMTMELDNGYGVGVYVGFDDNRPMEKGTTHLTGAMGALPVWTDIAADIVNLNNPADRMDLADLSFNGLPLAYPQAGQVFVPVDPDRGGVMVPGRGARAATESPDQPAVLSYGHVNSAGNFEPDRLFRPFWKNF